MKCLALAGATLLGAAAIPHAHADTALARAQEIAAGQCFVCHGADGENTTPLFPRLAGQHAAYIVRQLEAFGQRQRTNDNAVMQAISARLSPAEMQAVAAYASGLK